MPPSNSNMDSRNARGEPDPQTIAAFKDTPWAANLFSDPTLTPFSNDSRVLKSHTGDSFCASTLNTPETISAWQSFYRFPQNSPNENKRTETLTLLKLGTGVNGHRDICHGGFVSLLLDEVLGSAAENERPEDKSTMTAYLKVDYRAPVRTPGVVLCRAWVEKKEGKKIWTRGTVEVDEGDGGKLKVAAEGEALFIIVEESLVGKAKL
ncbi:uncharacterized protein PAC_18271 [Phialocephala subalpina]|uniref:Thioesterase domain-containing protein n=1 Tax=Phialocephala subalpina TaxID=576137 RepID=A0A1L7XTL5_9HELO|nr:uncharacterized protein PAC_18271 [Phialocephala subalpina]